MPGETLTADMAARGRRRRGVGFRLIVALLAVFGVYLVSTGIVVYALLEQYWGFEDLSGKNFGRAMTAAELTRDAEVMATEAFEEMLGVNRSYSEDTPANSDLVEIFQAARAALDGADEPALAAADKWQKPYLDSLTRLRQLLVVERQYKTDRLAQLAELARLSDAVGAIQAAARPGDDEIDAFSAAGWAALGSASSAFDSEQPGQIAALRAAADAQIQKIRQIAGSAGTMATTAADIDRVVHQVFETRLPSLQAQRAALAAARQTRVLAQKLTSGTVNYYLDLKRSAQEATRRHEEIARATIIAVILLLAIAVVITVLVVSYIGRSIVRRLNELNGAMSARVDGTPVAIPTGGADEIADMGHAFEVFVTARDQAERALDAAREEAEQANRAKGEFLANMSHEIRTPLNGIIGFATLVQPTQLNRIQTDYIDKILRSAEHLLRVIDDILDFSKIEAGQFALDRSPFDLREVMETVTDILGAGARTKGIVFVFVMPDQMPRALLGDRLRLVQILVNLAGNAIKFTETGGVVLTVAIAGDSSTSVTLCFSVRDTGIGMTEEQLKGLFGKFHQADASITRRFGGTGLGLAISKHLVGLMGGEIGVVSTPGGGSTFSFQLEFGCDIERLPCDFLVPDDIGHPHILLADPDPLSRASIHDRLLKLAFQCTLATTGRQAIEEWSRAVPPFDLAILDESLVDPGWVEAAEEITRAAAPRRPPIIGLVAHAATVAPIFAATIEKPVRTDALFDGIVKLLNGQSAPAPERPPAPTDEWHELRGRRVLLVDDQPFNREIATVFLKQQGVVVEVAAGGREAVDRVLGAEPGHYDAVLMDVQMPEMDGFQATRLIRATYRAEQLPIIAMTAHTMDEQRVACLEAGMDDHIAKPINVTRLWSTVRQWLRPRGTAAVPAPIVEDSAPTAADALPDRMPGFDLAAGIAHVGGDPILFRRMLGDFPKWALAAEAQLKQALGRGLASSQDLKDAELAAHSLVGMATSVSATVVADAARNLEHSLARGETAGVDRLFRQVQSSLQEACDRIADLGATVEVEPAAVRPEAPGDFPWPDRRAALGQIALLLERQDFEAETSFQAFMRFESGGDERTLATIAQAIDGLDYRHAAVLVRGMLAVSDETLHG